MAFEVWSHILGRQEPHSIPRTRGRHDVHGVFVMVESSKFSWTRLGVTEVVKRAAPRCTAQASTTWALGRGFAEALCDADDHRGTRPSHAAVRPRAKVCSSPTAATRAVALSTPIPGMLVSRRADSFRFASAANSSSNAAIRSSSVCHAALDQQADTRAQLLSTLPQKLGDPKSQFGATLRYDYPALEQNSA
jgi:hypothetical protein